MLTGVNRIKTTGRPGSQIENQRLADVPFCENAIPPTSTGAIASSQRISNVKRTPTLGILPGPELVAVPH